MKVWCLTLFIAGTVWITRSREMAPLVPTELRCEDLSNPLGIDVLRPRLSWILKNTEEDARNRKQTAYQILAAGALEKLKRNDGDLWDSGKVSSEQSVYVAYSGRQLTSRRQCFWKVRVWDEQNDATQWSKPALWSMGLLQTSDWRAKWISLEEPKKPKHRNLDGAKWIWFPEGQPASNAPVSTRYLRRIVDLGADKTIQRAIVSFAADDRSAVFMNGHAVGEANSYRIATEVDVTKWLQAGTNVLAARGQNLDWEEDPNPAGFIAMLKVEFTEGAPSLLGTDSTWKCSRTEIAGWTGPDFDESNWVTAAVVGESGGKPWGEIETTADRRLAARMFRHEFQVEKPISRATVYFSGLGVSELYLNGEKVGDEVLSPGLTDYSKRVFYRTFDVTSRLKPGKNAVAAMLGNGRFFSPRLREPTDTVSYGFPQLRLQLELHFDDNSTAQVLTDESWKVSSDGPIQANNEYDGEEYDARREMEGWNGTGFDDSNWAAAQVVEGPPGRSVAQMIEPTRVTETIKPREITQPEPGIYVFDFGQNLAGWARLQVKGPAGTRISMQYAERLHPDGTVDTRNLRSAIGRDVYFLKGGGAESYEPRFTCHGFRYVAVRGFPGKPDAGSVVARVVGDDLRSAGEFQCSDGVLNSIYQNIVWTVRSGYRSIPADCPNRDERQGWLGDRAEESRGETYIFDVAALYRKWLVDMADAQKPNGSIPDICPPYWPICPDDVTWPSASVIVPGMLLDEYGDMRPIRNHYANMAKWLDYICGFVTNGIIKKDAYKDWCVPPDNPKLIQTKDPSRKTAKALLATAYLYHDVKLMSSYARLLENEADSKKYEARAGILKKAFNREFLRPRQGRYDNGTQTSSVLPLSFGLVPERYRSRVFDSLTENISKDCQMHLGTGLIGGQWLLRVLSNNGRPDLAYSLASQTTYPSWGYMVENGATTIWELWNGNTAEMRMNSGNHVMLIGDLTTWLYEGLGGIRPDSVKPGFKHIILRCEPVDGLRYVKASHLSPYGKIISEWKRKDSKFGWKIAVPVNATATIYFPSTDPKKITESGHSVSKAEGVRLLTADQGRTLFLVGSGNYHFETK